MLAQLDDEERHELKGILSRITLQYMSRADIAIHVHGTKRLLDSKSLLVCNRKSTKHNNMDSVFAGANYQWNKVWVSDGTPNLFQS